MKESATEQLDASTTAMTFPKGSQLLDNALTSAQYSSLRGMVKYNELSRSVL